MRLDSANRAFFALVAVALAPYIALGVFGCGLLSYLAWRVAADGPSVLTADGDLRPATAFFAVVATGTVLLARSLWSQHRATRRLRAHVAAGRVDPTPGVLDAAARAAVGDRVDVVDSTGDRRGTSPGTVSAHHGGCHRHGHGAVGRRTGRDRRCLGGPGPVMNMGLCCTGGSLTVAAVDAR